MLNESVITDLLLVEFFEKKTGTIDIVEENQVYKWNIYFDKCEIIDPTIYISASGMQNLLSESVIYGIHINNFFKDKHPIILQALNLCEGKLSLCGISTIMICINRDISYLSLCFHSCTVEEANNLLFQCLQLFEDCIFLLYKDSGILVSCKIINIFFSFSVSKNKEQLLKNLGVSVNQHCWDPINGYFTSFSGGISVVTSTCLLDPGYSKREIYYYYNNIGFNIAIIGLGKKNTIGKDLSRIIKDINFKVDSFTRVNIPNFIESGIIPFKDLDTLSVKYFENTIIPNISLDDWCKRIKDYKKRIVGISNDRYIAFANCKIRFNINSDIFKVLCLYWLAAETKLAKERLLTMKHI